MERRHWPNEVTLQPAQGKYCLLKALQQGSADFYWLNCIIFRLGFHWPGALKLDFSRPLAPSSY